MVPNSRKTKQIYLIFLTGLILTACHRSKDVDVSNINVNVKIERFDHDLDAMRTKPMAQQAAYMQKKYGAFYRDFIERIITAGSVQDTNYFKTLRDILNSQSYRDLKHDVDSVYPNMDKPTEDITDAFKHIKYYYPQKQLPKVYAYFSGFQLQTSLGDGYLAIGLDMFLGANSRFYPALMQTIPHYESRRFTPEYIAPRTVEVIAREDMFPESDNDKSALSKMVYNGKILYFMDRMLPNVPDSVKIGYTAKQIDWCNHFEPQIWGYFLEENLLYETDWEKIQKYFGEAPFTPGLGEKNDSAPKLGVWTGWQIVRHYMEKHPEVTLQQLMKEPDAQKILNGSKYRPK
ncbi:MAG: gliding motility lipoprotein GldB [Mucilaginibacter sp.]